MTHFPRARRVTGKGQSGEGTRDESEPQVAVVVLRVGARGPSPRGREAIAVRREHAADCLVGPAGPRARGAADDAAAPPACPGGAAPRAGDARAFGMGRSAHPPDVEPGLRREDV